MAATIHTTAVVEPGARIDSSAIIGPFCSIGRDVVIRSGVRVEPQVVLEGEVLIGQGSSIGAGAVIRGRAVIGARTVVFPYAIVGEVSQFPGQDEADGMVQACPDREANLAVCPELDGLREPRRGSNRSGSGDDGHTDSTFARCSDIGMLGVGRTPASVAQTRGWSARACGSTQQL